MNRDVCEHFAPADLHCEKCDAIGDTVVVPDTVRDAAPDLLEALELCLEELDSCDPEFEGTHYCGRCDSAIDRNHEIREKAARAIAKAKEES